MAIEKETEQKINELQMLEMNMQQFARQKQQFQAQLMEIESALNELSSTDSAYKIVGNIMVKSTKEDLNKDLASKKEMLELRIKSIEKQESAIKQKAEKLQKEVLGKIEESEGRK